MDGVVLVHGLWMRGAVFAVHAHWLRQHGFATHCFTYASVRAGIAESAAQLDRYIAAVNAPAIHLVGHSLGGLVVLGMLAHYPRPRVRRAVLMGVPVRGSHSAGALLQHGLGQAIVGRALRTWRPAELPALPSDVEIGVLAGTRSLGFARLIGGLPQPNDGVVAVAETRLAGAADAIDLDVAHSQMLVSRGCAEQVAAFLTTGRFVADARV